MWFYLSGELKALQEGRSGSPSRYDKQRKPLPGYGRPRVITRENAYITTDA
jgi:hypothetical protein